MKHLSKILIGVTLLFLLSGCTTNTPNPPANPTTTPTPNQPSQLPAPAVTVSSASECSALFNVESGCAALSGATAYYLPAGESVLTGSTSARYDGIGKGSCQWTKSSSLDTISPSAPFQTAIVSLVLFDSEAKATQELQDMGAKFNATVTNDSTLKISEPTDQYPFGTRMFLKRVGDKLFYIIQITGGGASVYCSPTEEEALATILG